MIRGATSKLAAALGLTGGNGGRGREAGESAPAKAAESSNARAESEKSRVQDQAAPPKSVVSSRPRRRALLARVRKCDAARHSEFIAWLQQNWIVGEVRAIDLFRCYREYAQATGAVALTPRQLAIALGVLGIPKRRLRVRDRSTGRVAKLATGVPVRATRYLIPDQTTTAATPDEAACVTAAEQQTATGASATVERAA